MLETRCPPSPLPPSQATQQGVLGLFSSKGSSSPPDFPPHFHHPRPGLLTSLCFSVRPQGSWGTHLQASPIHPECHHQSSPFIWCLVHAYWQGSFRSNKNWNVCDFLLPSAHADSSASFSRFPISGPRSLSFQIPACISNICDVIFFPFLPETDCFFSFNHLNPVHPQALLCCCHWSLLPGTRLFCLELVLSKLVLWRYLQFTVICCFLSLELIFQVGILSLVSTRL